MEIVISTLIGNQCLTKFVEWYRVNDNRNYFSSDKVKRDQISFEIYYLLCSSDQLLNIKYVDEWGTVQLRDSSISSVWYSLWLGIPSGNISDVNFNFHICRIDENKLQIRNWFPER